MPARTSTVPVDVLTLARQLELADERYWFGDLTLAARPCAAVLNSAQGRFWRGSEPWVDATVRAAAALIDDEKTLLAATGLATWELSAWAASEALGNVILLVPLPAGIIVADAHLALATVLDEFGLSRQNALCLPWFVPPRDTEKAHWKARDAVLLRNADRLLPVSIRPGGFLDACLADDRIEAKADDRFRVEHSPSRPAPFSPPGPDRVRQRLADLSWDHAVHWTRAAHGPWPGETRTTYYADLVAASGDRHPRDARATLARIVREGRVRGTSRHMPMNVPMVSFSRLHPAGMVERMRWRKRYVRVEYEPWGIAVRCGALQRLGARDVLYGDLAMRKTLNARDRLYFQTVSDRADWENEREMRLKGDLLLSDLDPADVIVFVRDEEAAEEFRVTVPFEVRALT